MKCQRFLPFTVILAMLLSTFLIVSKGLCQDETDAITLTRYKAIAMAIRNNIDLRVRALDSSLAETNIRSSESIYNPQLSLASNYAQTNVAGETYGTETVQFIRRPAIRLHRLVFHGRFDHLPATAQEFRQAS